MKISFDDCCKDLLVGEGGNTGAALEEWKQRSRQNHDYQAVIDFVMTFTHEHLFNISHDDVSAVINKTSHALGDVKSHEMLDCIENFDTPFALQHLFHWYIEENQKAPTWKEFLEWIKGTAAPYWYTPLKSYIAQSHNGITKIQMFRAAKWRLGKFYQSSMRELELLARLIAVGAPVRYHMLADVLFKVDCWVGNVLVCVYVPNRKFKNGKEGRKRSAKDFFSVPSFEIQEVAIDHNGSGRIWLVSDKSFNELVKKINSKI